MSAARPEEPGGGRPPRPGPAVAASPQVRAGERRRSKRPLVRLLRGLLGGVAVTFLVLALVDQWDGVRRALGELSAAALALGLLAVLCGLLASMQAWRTLMADLGSALPPLAAVRVLFLGQLGKYVPGSVWAVVAQGELASDHGVPRRTSAAVAVVHLGTGLVVGLLLAVVSAPLLAAEVEDGRAADLLRLLPLLALPTALLLVPRVLTALVNRALRLLRRPVLEHSFTAGGVTRCALWSLAMWVLFGVQAWVLAVDLGGSPAALLPLAVGAFAAAWSLGFLVLFLPAGAGVREYILVVTLAPVLPAGAAAALTVALVSRLLMTLGDVGWALVALAVGRRARRRSPPLQAPR